MRKRNNAKRKLEVNYRNKKFPWIGVKGTKVVKRFVSAKHALNWLEDKAPNRF